MPKIAGWRKVGDDAWDSESTNETVQVVDFKPDGYWVVLKEAGRDVLNISTHLSSVDRARKVAVSWMRNNPRSSESKGGWVAEFADLSVRELDYSGSDRFLAAREAERRFGSDWFSVYDGSDAIDRETFVDLVGEGSR